MWRSRLLRHQLVVLSRQVARPRYTHPATGWFLATLAKLLPRERWNIFLIAPSTFTVLDEMWRALRVGHGLVDRADALTRLTRLNRREGTGIAFITHSLADLEALSSEEDRAKARGFAERSAVLMIGPCSDQELDAQSRVRPLSAAERREVLSWSSPPSWSGNELGPPVGLGNFLVKVGSRPGIPVHLEPTDIEKQLGNTNFRWIMDRDR